jgi:hypothetical protein
VRVSGRLVVPLSLLLIALLSWAWPRTREAAVLALPDTEGRCGEGWVEGENGVLTLHLAGTPYEMGLQQGVLLRSEIREEIRSSVYQSRIQEGGVSHLLLLRLAREIDGHLASEYREEMAGLAEGAGVSYAQVLLLNTYQDVISQPWPEESTQELVLSLSPAYVPHFRPPDLVETDNAPTEEGPAGRSLYSFLSAGFSAFGQATLDAGLIQAAAFAAPLPATDELVVVHYRPSVGNSFVAVRRPGMIGLSLGLNEERVAVTALPSPSQDASLQGVPLPLLLREVLQYAGDIPAALRIVASAERSTGYNVLIGDGKRPDAQVAEFSAHQYAVMDAENDLVVRTNHYLDPVLRDTQVDVSWWDEDTSWEDLEALLNQLERRYGSLDPSEVVRLLEQVHAGDPGGCGDGGEGLVIGVLMDASDLDVRVVTCDGRSATIPALHQDWTPGAAPALTTAPSR